MNINFDILVSGCNTRCKHCYVNGGPGSMMKLEDAFLFIEKLDALAELLPFEASFTLDNEPMNHPDIASIIRKAKTTRYILCYNLLSFLYHTHRLVSYQVVNLILEYILLLEI